MEKESQWKTWMLGVLLTITMAVSGKVYAGVLDRLDKQDAQIQQNQQRDVDVLLSIAHLGDNQEEMKATLYRLEGSQGDSDAKIQALVNTLNKNSRYWYEMMRKYENSLPKER